MSFYPNFVESTVPIQTVLDTVKYVHTHENKTLLDSLLSNGSSTRYLGEDGKYHEFPPMFFVDAFLSKYNNSKDNVTAYTDDNQNLYFHATNVFAGRLDDKVVGRVDLSQTIAKKQVGVDISYVDVNKGTLSSGEFKNLGVDTGLNIQYADGVLTLKLATDEAPFINLMKKVSGVVDGEIGVFGSDGQIKGGITKLSELATKEELQTHEERTDIHVTEALQQEWSAKQTALDLGQLDAVNSGINASKVEKYENYDKQKLNIKGHPSGKNVVTDASGNITTEDKFDHSTKIDRVDNATQNAVAVFDDKGYVKDSQLLLGNFPQNQTVKTYMDNLIYESISGSSYQGLFTYFGSMEQVEAETDVEEGSTAIVYVGELDNLGGLLKGNYTNGEWTFENVDPAPKGGAWFESDHLLTTTPHAAGRIVVRMDGVNPPSLDVRLETYVQLDQITVQYDDTGSVSFKTRTLTSGKQVLNATTADQIAFEFTVDSTGVDNSVTVKQAINQVRADSEPKFDKNTAFNKNFDTSHQTENSTMVIGDKDTRLSDARVAADVYAWAKEPVKPSYTPQEVGALPVRPVTDQATQGSTDLFTSGGAFNLGALKQNNIAVQTQAPVDPKVGDIWFEIYSGNSPARAGTLTLKRWNGSAWDSYELDKPQIPYVCTICDEDNASEGNIKWASYDQSEYLSSATIPFALHGKGEIQTTDGTIYVPRVRVFEILSDTSLRELVESPVIDMKTGAVTVTTSSTSLEDTPFIMVLIS